MKRFNNDITVTEYLNEVKNMLPPHKHELFETSLYNHSLNEEPIDSMHGQLIKRLVREFMLKHDR